MAGSRYAEGLPFKSTYKTDLIAEHDRTGGRAVSPRGQVVAARAASPPRKGRVPKPVKIRSEAEQQLNDQLFRKVTDGELAAVNRLIKEGADVNAATYNEMTALMYAAREGHREIVERLVAAGAHVNASTENDGWTPLMLAREGKIVKILIAAGANVNAADNKGGTALIYATWNGYSESVKMLLNGGADVNAADLAGWTALSTAISRGYGEIVGILFEAGSDPTMRNNRGQTARDIYYDKMACMEGVDRVMEQFDRVVEESTPPKMIKAARQSPARSPRSR